MNRFIFTIMLTMCALYVGTSPAHAGWKFDKILSTFSFTGGGNMAAAINDVDISGNYLYSAQADGYLKVYDITNPKLPTLVATRGPELAGVGGAVKVSGVYAYTLFQNINASLALPLTVTFVVWDVSNPTNPQRVGSVNIPIGGSSGTSQYSYLFDLEAVTGTTAYVSGFRSGCGCAALFAINATNPSTPIIAKTLGSMITDTGHVGIKYLNTQAASISGNRLYASQNENWFTSASSMYRSPNFIAVYDISNPLNPIRIGQLNSYSAPSFTYLERVMVAQGNYLYTGSTDSGFRIFNVSNPAAISLLGRYTLPSNYSINDIAIQNPYAYLVADGAGYEIMNIANLSNPYLETISNSAPGHITDFVYPNYAVTTSGGQITFLREQVAPTIALAPVTGITNNAATLNSLVSAGTPDPFSVGGGNAYFYLLGTTSPASCAWVTGARLSPTLAYSAGSVNVSKSYRFTSLLPATTYYYCAYTQADGVLASTSIQSFTTTPTTPTGLTATPNAACGSGAITITWNAVAGATSYDLEIDGNPATTPVFGTTYTHSGLTAGSAHTYRVSARNGSGASAYSAPQSASVAAACAPCPSGTPVSWTVDGTNYCDGTTPGATSGTSGTVNDSTQPTTGSASYLCTNGTWAGAPNAGATCSLSAPAAPTGMTATPQACGTGDLFLDWNDVVNATSYSVYTSAGTWVGNSLGSNYLFDTGALGTTYNFYVRANDSVGTQSANSTVFSGTTAGACAAATGTITAPSCVIPEGASSCSTSVSWNTSGATDPTVTQDGTPFSTAPSSGGTARTIQQGTHTFSLYDGATPLDTVDTNAACDFGLTWNSATNLCEAPVPPALPTLTVSSYMTPLGSTVDVTWDLNGNTGCTLTGPGMPGTLTTDDGTDTSDTIQGRTTFTLTCGTTVITKTVEVIPTGWEG